MKKVIAFAAVAMIALASCKKDYTCDCEITMNGETTDMSIPIKDAKKKDAQDACDAAETTYANGGSASCELK